MGAAQGGEQAFQRHLERESLETAAGTGAPHSQHYAARNTVFFASDPWGDQGKHTV